MGTFPLFKMLSNIKRFIFDILLRLKCSYVDYLVFYFVYPCGTPFFNEKNCQLKNYTNGILIKPFFIVFFIALGMRVGKING